MQEINRAKRLSQAPVRLVGDRASLFTDQRMSCLQNLAKKNKRLKKIFEHTFDNSPTDSSSRKSAHPSMDLNLCITAQSFAILLDAFLSMSFHVVRPCDRLRVRFVPRGSFSVAVAEIRDWNISLDYSKILSFARETYSASFQQPLMSSRYTDKNNPYFRC